MSGHRETNIFRRSAGETSGPFSWRCSRGGKHFAPEGASFILVDAKTGAIAVPAMVDQNSGRPLLSRDFKLMAGPAASERTRERVRRRNAIADQENQPMDNIAGPASQIRSKGGAKEKNE